MLIGYEFFTGLGSSSPRPSPSEDKPHPEQQIRQLQQQQFAADGTPMPYGLQDQNQIQQTQGLLTSGMSEQQALQTVTMFPPHMTPQQQQMYQQHMQLQHQAQHLKKIRRSLPHSNAAAEQLSTLHQLRQQVLMIIMIKEVEKKCTLSYRFDLLKLI